MGTRSAVCEPRGNSYRGRYVHWDGYPTGVGACLLMLVQRDGLEKVRQTIVHDHYGWSSLNGEDEQDMTNYRDGRFAAVPNYGVAYTTKDGQSDPSDWVTPDEGYGTEWRYILADDGLWVLSGFGPNPAYVATVPYDSDLATLSAIEEHDPKY